jgi:hypothetical protein
MQTFTKADVGVMDFSIDYYLWLGTDTLATSTWIAEAGITIDSNSFTNTMATVILSGGTIGSRYKAYNTITTTGGDTDCLYITISVIGCR